MPNNLHGVDFEVLPAIDRTKLSANSPGSASLHWLRLLTWLCLCAPLAGCVLTPAGKARVILAKDTAPPELEVYRLAPGDRVGLRFFYTPELDLELEIRPDGRISIPLAQGIEAAGKTPEELAAELEEIYDAELVTPRIAVIAQTFGAWSVHVDGQVAEPGRVPLTHGLTLLDAISEVGGALDSAYRKQVLVLRRTPEGTAVVVSNLERALSGGEPWQNIALHPRDIVYVPRSSISNVNSWVERYVRLNLPFSVSYGFRDR